MKVKDLMLGNYVTDQKGKPVRVASINSKGITYGKGNMMHFLSENEMNELPLTAEILDNTFERCVNMSWTITDRLRIFHTRGFALCFCEGASITRICELETVSRLQLALNLLQIDTEIKL